MPPRRDDINMPELLDMYNVEELSIREIAEYYEASVYLIWSRLHKHGAEVRTISESRNVKFWAPRRYPINNDLFKTWTPESAWMYGWWLGDGYYLTNRYGIGFTIQTDDEEVLHKFRNILDSNKPIAYRHRYRKGTLCHSANIYFSSIKLASSIEQLDWLDIPSLYLSDFIRGFFEAEGYVGWHKYNYGGKDGHIESKFSNTDKDVLDYIFWYLQDFSILSGGSWCCIPAGNYGHIKDLWEIILGIKDSISLYHYLYDNCDNNFLNRKKEKFEELIERELSYTQRG